MNALDELNDVPGVKRASEKTEAEGAPDPKFAKFDHGACPRVCVKEIARANIWRAFVSHSSRIHTSNTYILHTIYTYTLHTPSSASFWFSPSLFTQELSPLKDPRWSK
jgi:hypothetical protein